VTQEEQILYNNIDILLWTEWDPIGVNEFSEARDEYRDYLPEVFRLKITNVDKEIIAKYLLKIEMEMMGLFGNLENCRKVADKIISM
jgi:hypothetical protein